MASWLEDVDLCIAQEMDARPPSTTREWAPSNHARSVRSEGYMVNSSGLQVCNVMEIILDKQTNKMESNVRFMERNEMCPNVAPNNEQRTTRGLSR